MSVPSVTTGLVIDWKVKTFLVGLITAFLVVLNLVLANYITTWLEKVGEFIDSNPSEAAFGVTAIIVGVVILAIFCGIFLELSVLS